MRGSSHTVNLCEIDSNDYYAIDIISGGVSDTLTGNVINDNLRGINLQSYCTNNIIRDNTISGNRDYGIQLAANCSNNQIYHNRFILNYPQVHDIGTNNNWDNGYPSGGNNWSDYTGYDNYSGPNQDMPGSDDIGDIPYSILGGQNKDNYPTGAFQTPKQPGDENQPPNAYIISISPNPAESGQLVSLSGSGSDSNGIVTAYEWRSTIDGKIGGQRSFQTTSLSVGVHTISFKVQDNDGAWSIEQTASITIDSPVNHAPIAYIDEITPNPAKQREAVLFRGHGTDEDGSIIAYKWLSSKDGVISTALSFSKTNLSLGTHTIYFQVKDNTEWSPQAIRTLVVEKNSSSGNPDNQAPIADVGGPYQGNINGAIMFDGSGSHDEEGAIVGYWNFGDNSSGTGLSPTHVYTAPGTYTVTLTVTDEDGDSTTASTSVAITQSTSQGNNAEGFSVFDLEIPFPIIIIVVFLSVLGVIIGFILRMKRG
jgi:parallel beta-helix repeat protein